jgi:hypothetical protein
MSLSIPIERMNMNKAELDALLERAQRVLAEEDYTKLKAIVETLVFLTHMVEDRTTSIQKLRQMLFGAKTEKTRDLVPDAPKAATETGQEQSGASQLLVSDTGGEQGQKPAEKPNGHGRNGASAYTGATVIEIRHETLKGGDPCPLCKKGKVYPSVKPQVLVRIVGQPMLGATVYKRESLRCNLCLEIFTARAPEGVGDKKYDEASGSIIALMRYGNGFPFHRLENFQKSLGIPLPASTQWEIVSEVAGIVEPAYTEVIRQAAQGKVMHNDDTPAKILALMKAAKASDQKAGPDEESERTGLYTSGIVSIGEHKIALFFTGRRHAGENLADVLAQRALDLSPPIQMCDALSRNLPKDFQVILGNCLAHGRREYVNVFSNFPGECSFVLETLRGVYKNDAVAKEKGMSDEERLAFHLAQSGPLMESLEKWLKDQERETEPNSGLGKAISYWKNHWEALTLFLRVPGVPLDNNIVERGLKKAIRHRRNSLFFKTENGAHVGDIFMTLIHTCELNGVNPFDYLTELQKHAAELVRNPQDWMPWNYRETMAKGRDSPQ